MKHKDKTNEQLLNELEKNNVISKEFEESEWELFKELEVILKNIPFGIVYLNNKFRIISSNKFFNDFTGFQEEELKGKLCYEIIGEYSDDPTKKGHEKICSFCKKEECFKSKSPTVIERPLKDKFIRVTTIPEFDEKGEIWRFLEIVEDITERRKAKVEIESISRFPSENTNPVLRINSDRTVLYKNEAFNLLLREMGLSGKDIFKILPENLGILIDKALKTEQPLYSLEVNTDNKVFSYNLIPIQKHNYVNLYGRDITRGKKVEEEKESIIHDMGERVKELRCLYGIAESIRKHKTVEAIFRDVVEFIPLGWHYPDITRGRILFDGQEYVSEPFEETEWRQTSDILINGKGKGSVEVYYIEECPELDDGPFLSEEQNLIDGIAHALSEAIERKKAEKELQKAKDELEIKVDERTADLSSTVDLLQKEITHRKQAEKQIMASLKEKEMLLQEIHHRVKNNMTVIQSLLELQSGDVKDMRYKKMFRESIDRIKSMAIIHENLYRSKDLAHINFGDYMDQMADRMYLSYGLNHNKVKLKKNIEQVTLGIDTAIPCGLILNELFSNSLKYAFPDDRVGEIRVELSMNDKKEVELTVGDNGVGMPEDLDYKTNGSLGLNLVNALVTQLRGRMEVQSKQRTEFKVIFRRN